MPLAPSTRASIRAPGPGSRAPAARANPANPATRRPSSSSIRFRRCRHSSSVLSRGRNNDVGSSGAVATRATRVARRPRPEPEGDDELGEEASEAKPDAATRPKEVKLGHDEDGTKLKWMEILEESAEYDPEIKTLLDGSNSDPNEVEKRIRERFEQRKERIYQEKEGSTVPLLVKFREFKSQNLWIHLESHNNISEMEQPLLDEVFKAWFVLGKLGGFNSDNMQVQANFFEVSNMEYDMDQANGDGDVPTAVFHAMGGPEYKGRWCRCWFDLGSADEMCVDVLINSLITFSREYFGLKTMVIGGENVLEDWPVQESEFYVDDAAEMDIEMGPFRPPPPGTDMGPMGGAGMSR